MNHADITDDLIKELQLLNFSAPVSHVYNPLVYARQTYQLYMDRYGNPPKQIVLVGMNPGPWGMAQTGVPFGEINAVKNWLGIDADINPPDNIHPKRPVHGLACARSEVSGKRLWGWVQKKFNTPRRFFARFMVINYCPLLFIDTGGANRTPDKLKAAEKKALFESCDHALQKTVALLKPQFVVGVGNFAAERAQYALKGLGLKIGRITHPSPANPKANQGWDSAIEKELAAMGIS